MILALATAVVAVLGMAVLWRMVRRTNARLETVIGQLEAARGSTASPAKVATVTPTIQSSDSASGAAELRGSAAVVRLDRDGEVVDAEIVEVPTPSGEAPTESGTIELAAEAAARRQLALDLLARQSLVKVAAFSHGVKQALAPANRNRIRFEMKQEVKRHRRARKDEVKVALREYRARERTRIADGNLTGENDLEGGAT